MVCESQSDEKASGSHEYLSIVMEVANYLEYLSGIGCDGFDCSETHQQMVNNWGHAEIPLTPPDTLDSVSAELGDCRRCLLSEDRTHLVFGKGAPDARIVFVGHWPDVETDRKGNPFDSASGELLSKIIKAMNLTLEDVYFCNIMKCRPASNKPPLQEEINICFSFLKRQITVIQPDVICSLGAFATQILLDTKDALSSIRGQFHDFNGIPVMPTYHPETLLADAGKKRFVWEDVQKIMVFLGV